MRVVVDEWIKTTLKAKANKKEENGESKALEIPNNDTAIASDDDDEAESYDSDQTDEYIIEQEIEQKLDLYQGSSDESYSSRSSMVNESFSKQTNTRTITRTKTEKQRFKLLDNRLLINLNTDISNSIDKELASKAAPADHHYSSCICIDNVKYYFKGCNLDELNKSTTSREEPQQQQEATNQIELTNDDQAAAAVSIIIYLFTTTTTKKIIKRESNMLLKISIFFFFI